MNKTLDILTALCTLCVVIAIISLVFVVSSAIFLGTGLAAMFGAHHYNKKATEFKEAWEENANTIYEGTDNE